MKPRIFLTSGAIAALLLAVLLSGCHSPEAEQQATAEEGHAHRHGDANRHMNQRPFEELVANFESPERAEWQKPDAVIAFLGDLQGKTVMDIGSGSGYFSLRLAEAGARVISADVDERFLAYIDQRKDETGLTDRQLETRRLPYDSPRLQPGEVDLVFMVNVYHHIEKRPAYFAEVRQGLKPNGRLVVIDFFKKDTPVGPPVEMKLEAEQIVEELRAAGFGQFEVNENLLPYQYIITAS